MHRKVRADEVDPEVKIYPDYCNSIFYVFNVATAIKVVNAAKVMSHIILSISYLPKLRFSFFRMPNTFSSTMSL